MTAVSSAPPLPWPSARTLAAAAALAVALAGRGDLMLLGVLLAIALSDRRSSIAVLLAVVAVAVRWGTTSAEAITGAVTTLGPGVRVGPPQAATAVGLASIALVLAGLSGPLLPRLAAVATASSVAVGPVGAASGRAVALGVAAAALALVVVLLLPRLMHEPPDRLRGAAPVAGALAVALAVIW